MRIGFKKTLKPRSLQNFDHLNWAWQSIWLLMSALRQQSTLLYCGGFLRPLALIPRWNILWNILLYVRRQEEEEEDKRERERIKQQSYESVFPLSYIYFIIYEGCIGRAPMIPLMYIHNGQYDQNTLTLIPTHWCYPHNFIILNLVVLCGGINKSLLRLSASMKLHPYTPWSSETLLPYLFPKFH